MFYIIFVWLCEWKCSTHSFDRYSIQFFYSIVQTYTPHMHINHTSHIAFIRLWAWVCRTLRKHSTLIISNNTHTVCLYKHILTRYTCTRTRSQSYNRRNHICILSLALSLSFYRSVLSHSHRNRSRIALHTMLCVFLFGHFRPNRIATLCQRTSHIYTFTPSAIHSKLHITCIQASRFLEWSAISVRHTHTHNKSFDHRHSWVPPHHITHTHTHIHTFHANTQTYTPIIIKHTCRSVNRIGSDHTRAHTFVQHFCRGFIRIGWIAVKQHILEHTHGS